MIAVNIAGDITEAYEIGYESVFFKNFETQIVTGFITFVILFAVFCVNLSFIRKGATAIFGRSPAIKSVKAVLLVSGVFSLVLCIIIASRLAPLYLSFFSSVPFGEADPIFGQDIGYYVFQRPFMSAVCDSISAVLLFQFVYTAVFYSIGYLATDFKSIRDIIHEKRIITHLVILIIIYFIANAVTFKFTGENILFGKLGELCGAGFTDVMVWHNYYIVAPILLLAVVIAAIIFITKGKIKSSVITVLVVPAVWILTFIVAAVVQLAFVRPYEVSMEQPYINYNIAATKKAFNLDNIEEREFIADNDLDITDIQENKSTIDNIRITDIAQTLTATNSLQGLRSFYSFADSDIITLDINGKKTALMVSAREFDSLKLPDTAKSYINKKLRYTHGYGIVASPVNTVTQEGQPQYIIKDIPTFSESGAPEIKQPRIYFGESTNDYAVVNTKYSELDYMEGDKTVEFSYDGKAGIPLNIWNRMVFAVKKADPMLLMSGYIKNESRLLCNRNVLERVKKAAPFLQFDNDPYMVIDYDGYLKWVVDAYTTTDLYPYAQKYNGISYIRNSAKALVDAYNGNVELYITDNTDPIIRVFSRMYPGFFHEEAIPSYVTDQMHYPEYIFKLQSEVYKTYHITEPEALYSRSDVWVTAKEKYASGETVDVEPYYNLMKLDAFGDSPEELVVMQPYTPQGKENLVSWIAARSNAQNYGKLIVYRFPKGKTVYGTLHIENKIDNDPNISKEISLWDQGGSSVIKGNLLVIPVKDSLLYVEPVYITAKNSAALPEIKRVVVAFDEKVAMEPTIGAALEVIFGTKQPTVKTTVEEKTPEMLISDAVDKYNEMENYSKNGEYKAFGAALDELGKILSEIQDKNSPENQESTPGIESTPTPSPSASPTPAA